MWGRAEELSGKPKYKGKYDVAVARAVAKLPELIGYCLPFLKKGGIFVAMKQTDVEREIEAAASALKKYNGIVKEIKRVNIGGIERALVLIEKAR